MPNWRARPEVSHSPAIGRPFAHPRHAKNALHTAQIDAPYSDPVPGDVTGRAFRDLASLPRPQTSTPFANGSCCGMNRCDSPLAHCPSDRYFARASKEYGVVAATARSPRCTKIGRESGEVSSRMNR